MKPETGTQGKITRMVFGAEAIEIKATIPDTQIESALIRFNTAEQFSISLHYKSIKYN